MDIQLREFIYNHTINTLLEESIICSCYAENLFSKHGCMYKENLHNCKKKFSINLCGSWGTPLKNICNIHMN